MSDGLSLDGMRSHQGPSPEFRESCEASGPPDSFRDLVPLPLQKTLAGFRTELSGRHATWFRIFVKQMRITVFTGSSPIIDPIGYPRPGAGEATQDIMRTFPGNRGIDENRTVQVV